MGDYATGVDNMRFFLMGPDLIPLDCIVFGNNVARLVIAAHDPSPIEKDRWPSAWLAKTATLPPTLSSKPPMKT